MRRAWVAALALAGCGGGGGNGPVHPSPVRPSDVRLPGDAPSAVKRCRELLDEISDALKVGKELHRHRPLAEELAVVCEQLGEIAAKSYAPPVAEKLGARGREMATEARKLANSLRNGDAASASQVHGALDGLWRRLEGDLPRGAKAG